MSRLVTFFDPVPPEMIALANDESWNSLLAELSAACDPSMRFDHWTEEDFPNLDAETKRVIYLMTNLNPNERATMSQILKDPWWREFKSRDR